MQAVLGIYQLNKLTQTISRRNYLNNFIWKKLKRSQSCIYFRCAVANIRLSPYRCYIKLKFEMIKKYKLKDIIKLLNSKEKICNEGSCSEMYLENSFKISNLSPKRDYLMLQDSAVSLAFYINPYTSNVEITKGKKNY